MKAIQRLRELLQSDDEENGIESTDSTFDLQSRVEAQKKVQQLRQTRLKDLVLQKSKDKLVFINPETEQPVFTDKGIRLIASKDASNDEIALMLEYAKEKYGGVLKLNGNDEFKRKCAEIAAEQNMNVILKPEQYNKLMKEYKAELSANQIQPENEEHSNTEQSIEGEANSSTSPQHTLQPIAAAPSQE
ncbi:relaxase, partial [Salmonella enterica]|nr:relaxase [Salmonella enterica]